MACLLALAACGRPAPPAAEQPTAAERRPDEPGGLAPRPTPTGAAGATSGLEACVAESALGGGSKSRAARGVSYDAEENTITLEAAEGATLAGVAAALGRPELLAEVAPGEWLLAANLEIRAGAALEIAAPEVRWLKLRSDADGFVWVKARGGRLVISDSCVSSWDPARQAPDEQLDDGRSFVLARDGAWMAIYRSRLLHLGYAANESYGLAWRLEGTGGEIVDSELAHNYYGLYTFEVRGLVIRGNVVRNSARYGIDPHTDSRELTIEDNLAYANGKHGIILAEGCSDSVIRNNTVYGNTLHGIVLYSGSNNNVVEGNTSYGNGQQGINLNDVRDNRVVGNTVYENGADGIGVGQGSRDNLVERNLARDNRAHGIYLYSEARGNSVAANRVSDNGGHGIYVKSAGNPIGAGNTVSGNAVGILAAADDLGDRVRAENEVYDNDDADVRVLGS